MNASIVVATFPALTVSAAGFTASLATDGRVELTNADSQFVGRGRFDGCSIVDCDVNIPEAVFTALEDELYYAV